MTGPIYRLLTIVLVAALSGGCGIFGKDEPADPPVELVKFDREFRVRQVWSVKIGGDAENLYLGLSPVSDGARVYAASHDGKVIAVDTVSGKTYWKTDTDFPFSGGPGVGEGMLVLGSGNGEVVALNTLDGMQRWQVSLSSEVLSTPAISRNIVVVRMDTKLIWIVVVVQLGRAIDHHGFVVADAFESVENVRRDLH